MEIVAEVVEWIDALADFCRQLGVMGENLVERVRLERKARLQVEIFAEREAAQVVAAHNAVKLGVFFLQAHDTAAGEDDAQLRQRLEAKAQLVTPVGLLEHLVDEQHAPASLAELARKLADGLALEVEVIHVDVQTLAVVCSVVLASILQQERGLAHTAAPLDADEAVGPVYLVHQGPAHTLRGVLHEIGVSPEESFHVCILYYK